MRDGRRVAGAVGGCWRAQGRQVAAQGHTFRGAVSKCKGLWLPVVGLHHQNAVRPGRIGSAQFSAGPFRSDVTVHVTGETSHLSNPETARAEGLVKVAVGSTTNVAVLRRNVQAYPGVLVLCNLRNR